MFENQVNLEVKLVTEVCPAYLTWIKKACHMTSDTSSRDKVKMTLSLTREVKKGHLS